MAEPLTVWRTDYMGHAKAIRVAAAAAAAGAVGATAAGIAWLLVRGPLSANAGAAFLATVAGLLAFLLAGAAVIALGAWSALRLRRIEPFCGFGNCNAHLSLSGPWRCGYCSDLNAPEDAWAGHTYFGTCKKCGRRPPAFQCGRCNRVNVILEETPAAELRANCARAPNATGAAVLVYDEEEERHKAGVTSLGRDAELIEAETRKLRAEFDKQVAHRRLHPPEPKKPEPPGDAVERLLWESMSTLEALYKARAERMTDLKRRHADDPETLALMLDLLDGNVERMRVEIMQGK